MKKKKKNRNSSQRIKKKIGTSRLGKVDRDMKNSPAS